VNRAKELSVHPYNVQRDYVFGWVLAGIYSASALSDRLVLKGGNCLRKAYFERARYSSDLDFATTGALGEDLITYELNGVCDFVQARAGVQFDKERTRVQEKKRIDSSKQVYEARLYFQDFFGNDSELVVSIRMDISQFERIFLPVQTRDLIHQYSDQPLINAQVKCLKLEEMLAGKLKCLLQRRHSADLYDFVNSTFVNPIIDVNRREIVDTFLKMTIFGSGPGIVKELFFSLPFQVIRGLWEKFLVFPNNAVIEFDHAVSSFKSAIDALFGRFPVIRSDFAFFPPDLRNPIMEAGHSLTCLRIVYNGIEREVEPYSLKYKVRVDGVAREYLYVYDRTGGRESGPSVKSFVHQRIQKLSNTDIRFEPQYEVELCKAGETPQDQYFHGRPRTASMRRRSQAKYVVACPICGKRFNRQKYDTKLNPHKDKYGNKCHGSTGYIV
jgi:predicted nucleotidyltransferase component of viral defense system